MQQQSFTLNGSEFDSHLAGACIYLSHAIASAAEGNFNNMEERLKSVEKQLVKTMQMLPQVMQDEIVEITRLALEHAAGA